MRSLQLAVFGMVVCSTIASHTFLARAQGQQLARRVNGFAIESGLALADKGTAFGTATGFVIEGRAFLGFGITKGTANDRVLGERIELATTGPVAIVELTRQRKGMPVGLLASIWYQRGEYHADFLVQSDRKARLGMLSVSADLYRLVQLPPGLAIMSAVSYVRTYSKFTLEHRTEAPFVEMTFSDSWELRLAALLTISERNSFTISWSLSFDEGDHVFSVSLGYARLFVRQGN